VDVALAACCEFLADGRCARAWNDVVNIFLVGGLMHCSGRAVRENRAGRGWEPVEADEDCDAWDGVLRAGGHAECSTDRATPQGGQGLAGDEEQVAPGAWGTFPVEGK